MKKYKIILIMLLMVLTLIIPLKIYSTQVNPDEYKADKPTLSETEEMYKFAGVITGVVQIIGTIVSAGTLIVIGIRYMVSSIDEKAEYKERMIPYVIGAVLLFGATNIVNILYKLFIK